MIKRFILHAKRTAFLVEHDFIMATYLADRVIVYEGNQKKLSCFMSNIEGCCIAGTPSVKATANTPQTLLSGSYIAFIIIVMY